MTYYSYLDEMENLCQRACNARKVTNPDDPYLADIYSAAEEGFVQKKMKIFAADALAPVASARTERLEQLRNTVEDWEERAAYIQKEEIDGQKSKRTTA